MLCLVQFHSESFCSHGDARRTRSRAQFASLVLHEWVRRPQRSQVESVERWAERNLISNELGVPGRTTRSSGRYDRGWPYGVCVCVCVSHRCLPARRSDLAGRFRNSNWLGIYTFFSYTLTSAAGHFWGVPLCSPPIASACGRPTT